MRDGPGSDPDRRSHADVHVVSVHGDDVVDRNDVVVVEEPLAIRLRAGDDTATVAVTMRTPGDDLDLALGFLLTEGVVRDAGDVLDVAWCPDDGDRADGVDGADGVGAVGNVVTVTVRGAMPDLGHLQRHGTISSACGVCGRTSIDDLADRAAVEAAGTPTAATVGAAVLTALPARLAAAQRLFASTGGLHAAARFSRDGELIDLREDVGRHNALDKLIGVAARRGDVDWSDDIVLLSGRASWELLSKAVVVRAGIVAAVGAPSSLAVAVAQRYGVTLVGFLRDHRFNIYAHPARLVGHRPDLGSVLEPIDPLQPIDEVVR